jgi:uncharacterized integral membrane protein
MRFGLILLVLLFAVAGAVFGALNSQTVDLDFYFGSVALAKGGALLFALLAGWLLGGLLVYLSRVVPLRRRLRRQGRQLRRHEEEAAATLPDAANAAAGSERPQ